VIKFNQKNAEGRYADIAKYIGLEGKNDGELVDKLCEKINHYNQMFDIPKSLQMFGINEGEFKEKADSIAKLAVEDACTGSNPRPITPEEMEKLLNCIYYGTKVDF